MYMILTKAEESTTIRIKISTKKALEATGGYGETHDELIRRALELHKKREKNEPPMEYEKKMV